MIFSNLHEAVDYIGRNLYRFNGHSVSATHTSRAFTDIARDFDFKKKNPSVDSFNYDGQIMICGKVYNVVVTVKGSSIENNVEVVSRMKSGMSTSWSL